MHQISFDLKRGHLKTVAWGEKALRGVPNMTAARFDLLYLLRQEVLSYGGDPLTTGLTQRELWQRLDLDRSTISKMLRRLEEMGWIRRLRPSNPREWRTKKVLVTTLGLQRIAKAMRIMFRQRLLLSYFERIMKGHRRWKLQNVMKSLVEVRETIQDVARCFGDRSVMTYDLGVQLDGWPLGFRSSFSQGAFHPLYQPPPAPRLPPKRKGPRQPVRPIEFTEYENALRAFIWGDEKRRRRRPSGGDA